MLFVPLTRSATDPVYGDLFYLNIDAALSMTRALDNTHTRIRGTSVYTPPDVPVIEVLVIETPEEIGELVNAARIGQRMLVPGQMAVRK